MRVQTRIKKQNVLINTANCECEKKKKNSEMGQKIIKEKDKCSKSFFLWSQTWKNMPFLQQSKG
jgi:hypothetical protein